MVRASILFAFAFALAGCLSGCVQSVHPFYTDAQLTYDQSLVGTWTTPEQEDKAVITGDAENKLYHVVYTDDEGKTGKFEARLAKVQDQLLVDITPDDMFADSQSDLHKIHLLPVHSFMLLEKKDADSWQIREMHYDWLKDYLQKNPTAIAHEKPAADRILLTATTEKLQAFVLEHRNTQEAYEEPKVLTRVPDAAADEKQ